MANEQMPIRDYDAEHLVKADRGFRSAFVWIMYQRIPYLHGYVGTD